MARAQPSAETARLRWRCRRGLKELDVLLERYLEVRWPTAGAEERAGFERLLELPDPELAALLLGLAPPLAGAAGQVIRDLSHSQATELSARRPVYPGDPVGGRLPGDGL